MEKVYGRAEALQPLQTGYCPGCGHSLISKLICEVVDELKIREEAVLVYPIGCSAMSMGVFNMDMSSGLHGRACSVASGIKRVRPNQPVIVYQGDGDAAAIGAGETIHAATRGEALTVIMINNSIFGMTGGQMSPTSLIGQVTTTSQYGRIPEINGYPLDLAKIIATLEAPSYVTRQSVHSVKAIMNTKKTIKKALEIQIQEKGYSFVEILSPCPVGWKLSPAGALKYIEENGLKQYPVGDLKDVRRN